MNNIYSNIWTSVHLGSPKLRLCAVILARSSVPLWNIILDGQKITVVDYNFGPSKTTIVVVILDIQNFNCEP